MINQRKAVVRKRPSPPSAPRQLSIAFDPQVLHAPLEVRQEKLMKPSG